MIRPNHLKEGSKVLILSPSSKIEEELVLGAKKRLESWGLQVELSSHIFGSYGKFASTLLERAEDFQKALDSQEIDLILCARGGYGACQYLDRLDFTLFRNHPKWLMGFSDISALHLAFQKEGFMSMHSPMAKYLTQHSEQDEPMQRIKEILFGPESGHIQPIEAPAHALNQPGKAQGVLRGGNLAVTYGLRGTPWDYPAEDTILLIEDISEKPHAVERMLWNLRLSGKLSRLKGLIVGQFTDYTEDLSLGKPLMEAIKDVVRPVFQGPVCFDFPVGHVERNLPVVLGSQVELTINSNQAKLSYVNL